MAARKDENPSVATFADHEVITPPHALRKAVAPAGAADDDPVARAEAALLQLSSEFAEWMQSECERLETARRDVGQQGFNEQTHQELFRAAHDIKGEAATFGFPVAAGVAESLCRLLEHTPEIGRIPIELVNQHVDAVRAITREYARPNAAETAGALTLRLREVTDDFLRQENEFRPDYLDSIFSPPLVPGSAGT
jgi:HPt (histidine-containing phosphotransfer) domain-containing protein